MSFREKVVSYCSSEVTVTVEKVGPTEYLVVSKPTQDTDLLKAKEVRVMGLELALEIFNGFLDNDKISN